MAKRALPGMPPGLLLIFTGRLRRMIALPVLCLLAPLSGCTITRTVYLPAPVLPLPAELTAQTPRPVIPQPLTWGDSLALNVSLLAALGQCNRDKSAIRQAEAARAGPGQ
ncbi:Rz1-like lysis system protein LysC [Shimwellia pseudoproteus]